MIQHRHLSVYGASKLAGEKGSRAILQQTSDLPRQLGFLGVWS